MANKTITIKQYTGSGTNYDTLYPATTAEQASYSNTTTHSTATTVQGVIDELFTSVSNGKTSLASAITDKGQSTSPDDSFSTMATNINNIQTFKPEQSKTATQNGVTVYPDSGKALSSVNVAVTEYQGELDPEPTGVFNDNSWSIISMIAERGTGPSYWSVGDRKAVILNGTVGDKTFNNTTTYCFILGFDHNKSIEHPNSHAIHIGFGASALSGGAYIAYCDSKYYNNAPSTGYFSMNSSDDNRGGWNGKDGTGCQMKKYICPAFKNALPSNLKSNMRAVTKWQNDGDSGQSSSNEIWLLSEMEIFGSAPYSNYTANQLQYDFYKGVTGWSAASTIRYKDTSTSEGVIWWTRSAYAHSISYFSTVTAGGGGKAGYSICNKSLGFAPCLCL